MEEAQSQKGNQLFYLALGAAMGSAIALLAAPNAGAETRNKLASKFNQAKHKARSAVGSLRSSADEAVEGAKGLGTKLRRRTS